MTDNNATTATTSTIRPGILVAVKSSVTGGVDYTVSDLPVDYNGENGSTVERWETTKVVIDPKEHEAAIRARGKALSAIRAVCYATSFGLLCPEEREVQLDEAIQRARELATTHNAGATHTRVVIRVLKGRVADSDEQAARAIGAEVVSLIDSMSTAIDRLDPAAIRDAANRARQVQAMLTEDLGRKVGEAVAAARKAATQIVRRVEKGGEEAAIVLADIQRDAIETARYAFLDLADDEPTAVIVSERMPPVDLRRFAEVDSGPGEAEGEEGGSDGEEESALCNNGGGSVGGGTDDLSTQAAE